MTLDEFLTEIAASPAVFHLTSGDSIRDEKGLCPVCSLIYTKNNGNVYWNNQEVWEARSELGLDLIDAHYIVHSADHAGEFLSEQYTEYPGITEIREKLIEACGLNRAKSPYSDLPL